MGFMIPIIAGGAVAAGTITFGAAVFGVASYYYQDRQARKAQEEMNRRISAMSKISSITDTVKTSTAPREILYGSGIRKSGTIVLDHVPETNKNLRYLIIVLADHTTDMQDQYSNPSHPKFMIDGHICTAKDTDDPNWKTVCDYSTGDDNQYTNKFQFRFYPKGWELADIVLRNELSGIWTRDHLLYDMSHLVCKLQFDHNIFPTSPQISVWVDAPDRIFGGDFTTNPVGALFDYLTDDNYGMGIDIERIDQNSFNTATNICNANGWTIHGVISTDDDHDTILNSILDTFGGRLIYSAGQFFVKAAAWSPPILHITEADLRGPVKIDWRRKRSELFNIVRGIFIDPDEGEPSEYPPVRDESLIAEDGNELPLNVDFEMVNNPEQCQELANILLKRNRHEITANIVTSLKCFYSAGQRLMPFDTIKLTFSMRGWEQKYFEIIEWKLDVSGTAPVVHLKIQETSPSIYDPVQPAIYRSNLKTNIPDGRSIAKPENLSVSQVLKNTGSVKSCWAEITFDAVDDPYLTGYEVELQKDAGPRISVGTHDTTTVQIPIDEIGSYSFFVRSVNRRLIRSEYAAVYDVSLAGKNFPPSDVGDISYSVDSNGIKFVWPPVTDHDFSAFLIKKGTSWASAILLDTCYKTEYIAGFFPAGIHTFLLKAQDTSQLESSNVSSININVLDPGSPQQFEAESIGIKVVMRWVENKTFYPIRKYKIYRGDVFESAELLAETSSNFFAYDEPRAGATKYYVVSVDEAGNTSDYSSVELDIPVSNEYKLLNTIDNAGYSDYESFTNTHINLDEGLIIPAIPAESWAEHFQRAECTTIQQMIDQGFEHYLEPVLHDPTFETSVGNYVWIVDLGVAIPNTLITLSASKTVMDQDITLIPKIAVRDDVNSGWKSSAGRWQIYQTNFRYIRIELVGYAATGKELVNFFGHSALIDLNLKVIRDSGNFWSLGANPAGDEINFNKDFIDVDNIQVTLRGNEPLLAVVDFDDSPIPESFKIKIFDMSSGTQVDADGYWTAEGV